MLLRKAGKSGLAALSYLRAPEMAQHPLYSQDRIFELSKTWVWNKNFWLSGDRQITCSTVPNSLVGLKAQNKDPSAQPGFPCCAGLLWALSWSWYPSQHLLSCVSLPVCHQCCVLRPAHRTESTLWKCSHEFNTEWQLLIWQVTAWKSSAKNQINFASPSPDYHQEA